MSQVNAGRKRNKNPISTGQAETIMAPLNGIGRHAILRRSLAFLISVTSASLCWLPSSEAFVSVRLPVVVQSRMKMLRALPTPEESAKALSDYMAKAHEAKLKAVAEEAAKYKALIEVGYAMDISCTFSCHG